MVAIELIRVELWLDSECPNADRMRGRIERCLADVGVLCILEEHLGEDWLSPTVLVDGAEVAGTPATAASGCRLDLPTEEQITQAVHAAHARRQGSRLPGEPDHDMRRRRTGSFATEEADL